MVSAATDRLFPTGTSLLPSSIIFAQVESLMLHILSLKYVVALIIVSPENFPSDFSVPDE